MAGLEFDTGYHDCQYMGSQNRLQIIVLPYSCGDENGVFIEILPIDV